MTDRRAIETPRARMRKLRNIVKDQREQIFALGLRVNETDKRYGALVTDLQDKLAAANRLAGEDLTSLQRRVLELQDQLANAQRVNEQQCVGWMQTQHTLRVSFDRRDALAKELEERTRKNACHLDAWKRSEVSRNHLQRNLDAVDQELARLKAFDQVTVFGPKIEIMNADNGQSCEVARPAAETIHIETVRPEIGRTFKLRNGTTAKCMGTDYESGKAALTYAEMKREGGGRFRVDGLGRCVDGVLGHAFDLARMVEEVAPPGPAPKGPWFTWVKGDSSKMLTEWLSLDKAREHAASMASDSDYMGKPVLVLHQVAEVTGKPVVEWK